MTGSLLVSEIYRAQAEQLEAPAKGQLNPFTAMFRNSALEHAYGDFIEKYAWRREHFIQFGCLALFTFYGVLDVFAVGSFSKEFLTLRFSTAAVLLALISFIQPLPAFRRYVGTFSIIGVLVCSLVIIYMIKRMPVEGTPPYLVGVLFSMVLSGCLMRVRFIIAVPVYISIGSAYLAALSMKENVPLNEYASGMFFMWNAVIVIGVANYVQECRSRIIWLRNVQRERDSARISDLLLSATAADKSKASFLSVLTHELKTPLHQIIGFSELVKSDAAKSGATGSVEATNEVLVAANKMLGRVNQMLRYSAVSAGKLDFVIDTYLASEIIEDLSKVYIEEAEAKNIIVDIKNIQESKLFIDSHHTVYAIGCLIDNAIKASTEGATIIIKGDVLDESQYRIQIVDSGSGIDPDIIDSITSSFAQGASALNRENEGLGLGLSIATKVIEAQLGQLSIQSTKGEGTTVTVILPIPAPKQKPQAATNADAA